MGNTWNKRTTNKRWISGDCNSEEFQEIATVTSQSMLKLHCSSFGLASSIGQGMWNEQNLRLHAHRKEEPCSHSRWSPKMLDYHLRRNSEGHMDVSNDETLCSVDKAGYLEDWLHLSFDDYFVFFVTCSCWWDINRKNPMQYLLFLVN